MKENVQVLGKHASSDWKAPTSNAPVIKIIKDPAVGEQLARPGPWGGGSEEGGWPRPELFSPPGSGCPLRTADANFPFHPRMKNNRISLSLWKV